MVRADPTLVCIATVFALIAVLDARTANAQVQVTSWTPVQEGPAITAVLGRAAAEPNQRYSFELATRVDMPADSRHLVRLEAAKASWRFDGMEYPDPYGFRAGQQNGIPVSDRIAVTRVMASLIRRHADSWFGEWTPFYYGGGIGAYHFRSIEREPYGRPWRAGIHGLAGMEFPIPSTRVAIAGEVQLHLTGAPRRSPPGPSGAFAMISGSIGLKIRM